jgi:hypothetical protein
MLPWSQTLGSSKWQSFKKRKKTFSPRLYWSVLWTQKESWVCDQKKIVRLRTSWEKNSTIWFNRWWIQKTTQIICFPDSHTVSDFRAHRFMSILLHTCTTKVYQWRQLDFFDSLYKPTYRYINVRACLGDGPRRMDARKNVRSRHA